ncbi:unnamed protein product [Prorocentrum cordatum]|uniref:Uncharacterized protein n=1 Tax=Prorocentrum cordatum TaxID=2364126 RepID=A0ABN9QTV0_9DINO|nr:unnamed protein product [Polarella glacialis]
MPTDGSAADFVGVARHQEERAAEIIFAASSAERLTLAIPTVFGAMSNWPMSSSLARKSRAAHDVAGGKGNDAAKSIDPEHVCRVVPLPCLTEVCVDLLPDLS